jgi:hypothetical protein
VGQAGAGDHDDKSKQGRPDAKPAANESFGSVAITGTNLAAITT